ncbi:MAG: radical SAM protein [Candidatus Hadarchaeales archaeon]
MVERLRVAFGTGIVLGLWGGKQEVAPSTAHIMIDRNGKCLSNCRFCPKAKEAVGDPSTVSRVIWPEWRAEEVVERLARSDFGRICVQQVNYKNSFPDLLQTVRELSEVCGAPISVCCPPLSLEGIEALREAGAERMCIPLDCSAPAIFARMKGPYYTWTKHIEALVEARRVFGKATTHLIVGLGESEVEIARTIQQMHDLGVDTGLFAFFPVRGTPLENRPQPEIRTYRRVQVIRYLVSCELARVEDFEFRGGRIISFGIKEKRLDGIVSTGKPFMTSGCPHCNRPFFNESPRGPIYNYPRPPSLVEIERIKKEMGDRVFTAG